MRTITSTNATAGSTELPVSAALARSITAARGATVELDLNFEATELPSEPELRLNIYAADPETPTADGLKLLTTWAATRSREALESGRNSRRA